MRPNAFKSGVLRLNKQGAVANVLSKIDTSTANGKLFLKDTQWNTNWENTNENRKTLFFSTESWQQQTIKDLNQKIDVTDLKGYDLSPMITYMKNEKPWQGKSFVQHYFRVAGRNKTVWQEKDKTYFLKPKELNFNPNSNLPQFYAHFPAYELPRNKTGATSFRIADVSNLSALQKGYTFIGDNRLEKSKQVIYDYDDWLYNSGCPRAYTVSGGEVAKWLERVNENELLKNFINHFYERYKDYGYVVMDFEALNAGFHGKGVYKIEKCLEYWKTNPHTAKLAIWTFPGFGISRVHIESNNETEKINETLNFKGDFSEWERQIGGKSIFSTNSILANYVDFFLIGGYLNYPTNYGYLHHFLIQQMVNKKYFYKQKSLLSWWHNQEYVGDFELGWTYFKTSKGQPLKKYIKPTVFPDAMYNAAVWAFAVGDGGDLWSEPYYRTDNPDLWGWGENTFDMNDNKMPDRYGENSSLFAEQNYQNIDWWESGKWAVSQNNAIIEANTTWNYTQSKRNSDLKWNKKSDSLPHSSLYQKTPLCAYKLSEDKKTALLLVYDAWANPLKSQKIEVIVENRTFSIDVVGKYSSVVKLTL